MQSTFTGIEIGKRSVITHTLGLSTIGHNLSNASTEGYSRQRVELTPMDPIYMPQLNREEAPGQVGQGVMGERVARIKDEILEGRIVAQANGEGYWKTRDKYILMLEQVYNEPSDVSVRSHMDRFWSSWQELSLHPSEGAARKAVLQRGETLIDSIHTRYNSLTEIRNMLELETQAAVQEINTHIADIAALNEQIVKVKAMGDNPNDLLDRRDLLVEKLSGMINITTDGRDPDEFVIHTAGRHLVQGKQYHPFTTEIDAVNEGYSKVIWAESGEDAYFLGGKLASILEMRDGDVRQEIQRLDSMTMNFIDMVNDIHRRGYGLNGETNQNFFEEYPFVINVAGNYDRSGDGNFDSTYIFRITGTNSLDPQQQIGLRGTLSLSGPAGQINIDYFPTDTVEDIIRRINTSGSEVVASLDMEGKMVLKATPAAVPENPDFVIGHIEDSGQLMVGYAGILQETGPDGAFDRDVPDAVLNLRGGDLRYSVAPLSHPAGWIEVNRDMHADVRAIAAGLGEDGKPARSGDGSAALAIASLRNTSVMVGNLTTFDEYFADAVAEVGLKGEESRIALETQELIMKDLRDTRASISGVNIDEELSNMIKFQHGYAAAARFISVFNTMLDTIINRMGV